LACRLGTEPLTIDMPAELPTPDPDLTNALQALVDDGSLLAYACDGLATGHPDASAERVADTAFINLETDLRTAGEILHRDHDMGKAAGY
jgi:hypothetical protein